MTAADKNTEIGAKSLSTEKVEIDADCVGERWLPTDDEGLARLIAIIAMGQAAFAARILSGLAESEYSNAQLRAEARIKLTVDETKKTPRVGYPQVQRDGFIFEAISWLAARNAYAGVLIKAPHISATTQGLDGLMIELNGDKSGIERTTIFEDKCTDNARAYFLARVIPEFIKRHKNQRSAEIISAATSLVQTAGVDEATAVKFAAAVTDTALRRYRASFAVSVDSHDDRKKLFADYSRIDNVAQDQRIGASFVVPAKMREWFGKLGKSAVAYLDTLEVGAS